MSFFSYLTQFPFSFRVSKEKDIQLQFCFWFENTALVSAQTIRNAILLPTECPNDFTTVYSCPQKALHSRQHHCHHTTTPSWSSHTTLYAASLPLRATNPTTALPSKLLSAAGFKLAAAAAAAQSTSCSSCAGRITSAEQLTYVAVWLLRCIAATAPLCYGCYWRWQWQLLLLVHQKPLMAGFLFVISEIIILLLQLFIRKAEKYDNSAKLGELVMS